MIGDNNESKVNERNKILNKLNHNDSIINDIMPGKRESQSLNIEFK